MLTTPRYLCCTTQHERHEEHKGTGVNVCDSWTRNHELHTRLRHPLHKYKYHRRRINDVRICLAFILRSSEVLSFGAGQSIIKFNYLCIIFGALVHITGDVGRMPRLRRCRDRQEA